MHFLFFLYSVCFRCICNNVYCFNRPRWLDGPRWSPPVQGPRGGGVHRFIVWRRLVLPVHTDHSMWSEAAQTIIHILPLLHNIIERLLSSNTEKQTIVVILPREAHSISLIKCKSYKKLYSHSSNLNCQQSLNKRCTGIFRAICCFRPRIEAT